MDNNSIIKKNKWKKMLPFWIAIWSIFNLLLLFLCVFAVSETIKNNKASLNSEQIKNELDPLCDGDFCVYHDIEKNYYHFPSLSESLYDKSSFDVGEDSYLLYNFLMYNDRYYYFLVEETKGYREWEYHIARTNLRLDNFELIKSIGLGIRGKVSSRSGFDNVFYFRIKDEYYTFDALTSSLIEVDSDSREAKINELSNSDYIKTFGIELSKCSTDKSGFYIFSYNGELFSIDENIIDIDILKIIKKYKFEPYYHQSYSDGFSSIIFYTNSGSWDSSDCLIINYNRDNNIAIGYQTFHKVDKYNFAIYPKISYDKDNS